MADCRSDNSGSVSLEDNPAPSGRTLPSGFFEIAGGTTATNTGGLVIADGATLLNAGTLDWQTSDLSQLANITNHGTILYQYPGVINASGETVPAEQGVQGNFTLADFTDTSPNASTDPGDYTAAIDWLGDGSAVTTGNVTSDGNGGFYVSGNYTFASAGSYYPVVTITDTTNQTSAHGLCRSGCGRSSGCHHRRQSHGPGGFAIYAILLGPGIGDQHDYRLDDQLG